MCIWESGLRIYRHRQGRRPLWVCSGFFSEYFGINYSLHYPVYGTSPYDMLISAADIEVYAVDWKLQFAGILKYRYGGMWL